MAFKSFFGCRLRLSTGAQKIKNPIAQQFQTAAMVVEAQWKWCHPSGLLLAVFCYLPPPPQHCWSFFAYTFYSVKNYTDRWRIYYCVVLQLPLPSRLFLLTQWKYIIPMYYSICPPTDYHQNKFHCKIIHSTNVQIYGEARGREKQEEKNHFHQIWNANNIFYRRVTL